MTKHTVVNFNSLRNVTPPEEEKAGRKRYCGNAYAGEFFQIPDHMNIRDYLQTEVNGKPIKKSTLVNDAMRGQLEGDRSLFPILNGGISLIASDVTVDDKEKRIVLEAPSIINGSQTRGVLLDYFTENPPSEDNRFPSVAFEVIICTDERIAAEIAIARNYQNAVQPLSTYGARKVFNDLENALRKRDPSIKLRKSETDVGPEYWDTEKIIQVVTAMIPTSVKMPRPLKGKGGNDGIRVYAYAGKAVCLKDFAEVQAKPPAPEFPDAKSFFEDVAYDAWTEFKKLRSHQGFSGLHAVTKVKGVVAEDGCLLASFSQSCLRSENWLSSSLTVTGYSRFLAISTWMTCASKPGRRIRTPVLAGPIHKLWVRNSPATSTYTPSLIPTLSTAVSRQTEEKEFR